MWRRQVAPQGRLAIPQAGPSLVESFGPVVQKLSRGVSHRIEDQKQNDDNAVWAATQLAKAQRAIATGYAELEKRADAGAPGFTTEAAKLVDAQAQAVTAAAPDAGTNAYLERRFSALKSGIAARAIAFEAGARIAQRSVDAAAAVSAARDAVAADPSQLPAALGNLGVMIGAMPEIPGGRRKALIAAATTQLADAALDARLAQDPATLLAELKAGRWNRHLDASAKADAITAAEAAVTRNAAEARRQAQDAQLATTAAAHVGADRAIAALRENGTLDLATRHAIEVALPVSARSGFRADLARAAQDYSVRTIVASNAEAEDERLLRQATGDGAESFRIAVAEKRAAYATDPAAAAATTSAPVRAAWATAAQSPADVDTLKTAVALTILEQQRQGVAPEHIRPMPASMAATLTPSLQQALDAFGDAIIHSEAR